LNDAVSVCVRIVCCRIELGSMSDGQRPQDLRKKGGRGVSRKLKPRFFWGGEREQGKTNRT